MIKVFISSNQTEFAKERQFIKKQFEEDFFLKSFFEVFIFEDSPSYGLSPETTYFKEVRQSDIYIGLIGSHYGNIKESGLSATEEEYEAFHSSNEHSFFYIKEVQEMDAENQKFLSKIEPNNKHSSFKDENELIDEIKKSLVKFLSESQKDNKNYDKKLILESTIEDIDDEAYNLFFDLLKDDDSYKKLRNEENKSYSLQRIGAGEEINGVFHLNVAGALFFARDVTKFVSHEIKMVKFKGISKFDAIDRVDSSSSLLIFLNEFEKFYRRNTRSGFFIDEVSRVNVDEYPIRAIREAIINALAHRNYEISSSFIEFYIYDDCIEVISPGKLIDNLSIEDIKNDEGIGHRNERICQMFYRTNYMEHIGRGIPQMIEEMKNFGLEEPQFSEGKDSFKVVFKGNDGELYHDVAGTNVINLKDLGLNSRQIEILTIITNENVSMSYEDHIKMFGKSKPTAERDFSKLLKLNLIKRNKNGKKVYFSSQDY